MPTDRLDDGASESESPTPPREPSRQLRGRRAIRRNLHDPEQRTGTVIVLALAGLMALFLVYWVVLVLQLPTKAQLKKARVEEASIAYTSDGIELTRYYSENRRWVPLDSISENVVHALVATEDARFYQHHGIDIRRTAAAIFKTASGDLQGGSTITMQLFRNAFTGINDDFPITRKFKEWISAVRLERMYSKDEILEMYLNTVPFLYNAYGIESAAQTYFQKSANDLTVSEAATLVAMLKGTAYYNPVKHPDRSRERRNFVMEQMVENGYLDEAEYEKLKDRRTRLHFKRITRNDNLSPYFAEYLRQWLDDWAGQRGYNLYTDGLRIYTTIDAKMQEAANRAVEKVGDQLQAVGDVEWSQAHPRYFSSNPADYASFRRHVQPFAYYWNTHPDVLDAYVERTDRYQDAVESGVPPDSARSRLLADAAFLDSVKRDASRLEIGFVAMDPQTGQIKAWVGGRNFAADQYDHVALSKRQPGSAFKPFVYAAAVENGYSPNDRFPDQVIDYVDPDTKRHWSPTNVGHATGQMMTLRDALAYSKNTITTQLVMEMGPSRVAGFAHRMGITSDLDAVPSIGLGTSSVSLLEMTTAYCTLANGGHLIEPTFLARIEDRDGNVLAAFSTSLRSVISASTAYTLVDMMRGVVNYGTGQRIRSFGVRGDFAGKTGTTQNGADGWFMLMHPALVMGSWVGFETPSIPFRSDYWGQGAHNALYVVGNFIRGIDLPDATFQEPPGYFVPEAPNDSLFLAANSMYDENLRIADSLATIADSLAGDRWDSVGYGWTYDDLFGREDSLATDGEAEGQLQDGFYGSPLDQQKDSSSIARSAEPIDSGAALSGDSTKPRSYSVPEDQLSEVDKLNRQERKESNVSRELQRLQDGTQRDSSGAR